MNSCMYRRVACIFIKHLVSITLTLSFIQTGVRPVIPNQQLTSHPPRINNPPPLRLNNWVTTINKTPQYRLPRTLRPLISPITHTLRPLISPITPLLLFYPMYYQLENLKVRYCGCHDYIHDEGCPNVDVYCNSYMYIHTVCTF